MNLRANIEKTRKRLGIHKEQFSEVSLHAYQDILKEIWRKFTKLGHKAENYFWINNYIENAIFYRPGTQRESIFILKSIIPSDEKIWLIGLETKNEKPKYWLFEGDAESIIAILDEMYIFDFYLVSKKYQWIFTEEHSGVLIASGDPVATKLNEYKNQQS